MAFAICVRTSYMILVSEIFQDAFLYYCVGEFCLQTLVTNPDKAAFGFCVGANLPYHGTVIGNFEEIVFTSHP